MERVYSSPPCRFVVRHTPQVGTSYIQCRDYSLLSFASAAASYSHRKPTNKPTFDFVHSTCRRQRTRTLLHFIIFFCRHYRQCRSFPSHSAYLLYRCTVHATKTAVHGFSSFSWRFRFLIFSFCPASSPNEPCGSASFVLFVHLFSWINIIYLYT